MTVLCSLVTLSDDDLSIQLDKETAELLHKCWANTLTAKLGGNVPVVEEIEKKQMEDGKSFQLLIVLSINKPAIYIPVKIIPVSIINALVMFCKRMSTIVYLVATKRQLFGP